MLKTGHTVTIPETVGGAEARNGPETVAIPEELETVPGIPQDQSTVDFYSKSYPLESHSVEHFSYIEFLRETTDFYTDTMAYNRASINAASTSGDIEPTAEPVPGKDVTELIKAKAVELGFVVGITAYDSRYTYITKRKWAKPFPHTICLAMEQDYDQSQSMPSHPAEMLAILTYKRSGEAQLELAEFIRSLGYRAQIHHPLDPGAVAIPMFVAAGLGQLGANGQLLSPLFGARGRLGMITTDALLTHDKPVDYGIHAFCSVCQVCVNRCPGRALMRDKVWYRGVEKFKVIAKRCRPVMARYDACGICIKVCPVQKYGLKHVMGHYAATGQVLGKGTHDLEGYELGALGYFGPGDLPKFTSEFFHVPEGYADQHLLDELKAKIDAGDMPEGPERREVFQEFAARLEDVLMGPQDALEHEYDHAGDGA